MKIKKYKILSIAIGLGVFMSLVYGAGFFSSWRNKFNDKLFLPGEASGEIVIIAIDNESLQAVGRWPWDRTVHADLINKLAEHNPLIIGLDVNFSEASNPDADVALAAAVRSAGNVILPIEAELERTLGGLQASKLIFSISNISEAALAQGITNTPPDPDGIFRVMPLRLIGSETEKEYLSFAFLIAKRFLEAKEIIYPESRVFNGRSVTVDYAGPPGTYPLLPAHRLLAGDFEPGLIAGKIVLIGATAPDLHDEQITPVSAGRPMSGVEIHANAIATIIANKYIGPIGFLLQAVIFIILAVAVVSAVLFFRVRLAVPITVLLLIIYIIIALVLFDQGLVLDLFFAILTLVFTFLAAIVWRYAAEQREKRYIQGVFSRYVSPEVISDILENPKKLQLGGEKKELSIMFSDIRGFTAISEQLSPEQLVSLLNEYLTAMTDLIMAKRGVVDKYIGDAIMAFWGAPLEQPRHARLACRTALDMISALKENQKKWHKEFGVEIKIGIGINTGEVIIGNMGSDKRFDYTLMGDNVNLASRLEGITKQYGAAIVTSEFTRNQAESDFVFRYLDKVAVKGKLQGVKIYELLGWREEKDDHWRKLLLLFSRGVEYYQAQQWDQAIEKFAAVLKERPEDGPSRVYSDRCQELKANPPGKDWDGIFRLTTK